MQGRHLAAEFDANPTEHDGRKLLGLDTLNLSPHRDFDAGTSVA